MTASDWSSWAVQPTDEARAAVLAAYRRARRFRSPAHAMRQVLDDLALTLAYAFCNGQSPASSNRDRSLAEQFEAAHDYHVAIGDRSTAQAEHRGISGFKTFWHHGRIGGAS